MHTIFMLMIASFSCGILAGVMIGAGFVFWSMNKVNAQHGWLFLYGICYILIDNKNKDIKWLS